MPRCENCDMEFTHTDDVEHEEVAAVELEEQSDGPPRITIGTGLHDVWRCKGCGATLGVRRKPQA